MTGTMLATTTPPSIITSYLLANLPPCSLAIKQTNTQQTNKQINRQPNRQRPKGSNTLFKFIAQKSQLDWL